MTWARHAHGMVCMNQTRPHCVNQMGKIQYKPLGARHGRGMRTAWAWHGMYESNTTALYKSNGKDNLNP